MRCSSSPLICCTCSFKLSRRACGRELQAHAYGQLWPDRLGKINFDEFQKGMLQYHNTIDSDTGLSPIQMIFGRPIKEFIPILPSSHRPHSTWTETSRVWEEAMHARNVTNAERLIEHGVRLQR